MNKKDLLYLKMAKIWAENSYCLRKKVGAIIVKDDSIISDGYNGTVSGTPNICEDEHGTTKWSVLHAESNAIIKLAKSNNSIIGSTLYLTLSPCRDCCKIIHQSLIKRVVYIEEYRDVEGLEFLKSNGVEIEQITIND